MVSSALFEPTKIGAIQLKHRVVMAPMSRLRATDSHVPSELMVEHYKQRATNGGLIISDGALVSEFAGNIPNAPGLFTQEMVDGWKKITDVVHAKGGIMFAQIWHVGRGTSSALMPNNILPLAPSAIAIPGKNDYGMDWEVPHPMTLDEIQRTINEYANAAKNAIKAGFDGVEIHGAFGYIIDQFTNSSSNTRTDQYGGSIENRARFALEVVSEVAKAVGDEKTSIRFSPWSDYQGMKDDTPYETWGYIIDQLRQKHPKLAYIHMVEPRMDLGSDDGNLATEDTLDPFRAKWPGAFISAGGYTYSAKAALAVADATGNLISFGRNFTSNPDLVKRLGNDWPLTKYDRSTFYGGGAKGYTDFSNYTASTSV
ncbi:hypothetical protein BJV82DRAFT_643284 [Fennellomyces sp. T-0311]|nr:hypothetical protein BJV82DRAFT_643284 [Fennellomyces sp. T-0311]